MVARTTIIVVNSVKLHFILMILYYYSQLNPTTATLTDCYSIRLNSLTSCRLAKYAQNTKFQNSLGGNQTKPASLILQFLPPSYSTHAHHLTNCSTPPMCYICPNFHINMQRNLSILTIFHVFAVCRLNYIYQSVNSQNVLLPKKHGDCRLPFYRKFFNLISMPVLGVFHAIWMKVHSNPRL